MVEEMAQWDQNPAGKTTAPGLPQDLPQDAFLCLDMGKAFDNTANCPSKGDLPRSTVGLQKGLPQGSILSPVISVALVNSACCAIKGTLPKSKDVQIFRTNMS